ncbi:uracil-DNA glycosylase [Christensenellaceae bacterium OttesenSCG-928-K19]|nr:uracil-DNA glycosylase [Christensenellaceae bacterium OttesenSCG-928-K19]
MLEALYSKIREYYGSDGLVFGEGKETAGILLIGEAPGKDEVLQKRPFCGKAGRNLDEFLAAIRMKRQDIYITNVCKFRPYKVSEKGTVSNRPPTRKEILEALPFLYEEIGLIAPKVIVTLGNTPLRACYDDFSKSVGDVHGSVADVAIDGQIFKLFALYHPASIIYNRSLKVTYEEDLHRLAAYVGTIGQGT